MSWDRYSQLYDVVKTGNEAYRENRWDEVNFHFLDKYFSLVDVPVLLSNVVY